VSHQVPVTLRVHMHMDLDDVDKLIRQLPFFSEGETPRTMQLNRVVVEAVRDQTRDPESPYAEITVGVKDYKLNDA